LSLLDPTVLLNTLFSNTLSLCSSLSHSSKTRQNYSSVYLNL
jgi:hypothetical protein